MVPRLLRLSGELEQAHPAEGEAHCFSLTAIQISQV